MKTKEKAAFKKAYKERKELEEALSNVHVELTVEHTSCKHAVNSNITKSMTVESEEALSNVHVEASVEHASGKHTVNSNITKGMTLESEETSLNIHVEVGTCIFDG